MKVFATCFVIAITICVVPLFGQNPTVVRIVGDIRSPEEKLLDQEIRQLSKTLTAAASQEEKESAVDAIRVTLEKLFDAKSKRRETEINHLEKQLAKLRDLNKVRQSRRSELIDLELKTTVGRAAGTGF